jgi:hypothetical protein
MVLMPYCDIMRTTLTLDDDAYLALVRAAKRASVSLKEMTNLVIRRGLEAMQRTAATPPYELRPMSMGPPRAGVRLESLSQLVEQLDGDEHLGA